MIMAKPDKIEVLQIAEIECPPMWNARTYDDTSDPVEGSEDEGATFGQLVVSIERDGQDTPVIVRANKPGSKKPFFLVAGYRRIMAISKIADKKGDKAPTIKAIVRELDDLEARRLNVRENTARDGLKGADLVWAVRDLLDLQKKNGGGKKLTQQEWGDDLGLSQGYMGSLIKIAEHIPPAVKVKDGDKDVHVLDAWRNALKPISVAAMKDVAEQPTYEEKASKYLELSRKGSDKESDGSNNTTNWHDAGKRRAKEIGGFIGRLVKADLISLNYDESKDFFTESIGTAKEHGPLFKLNKAATAKEIAVYVNTANRAYNEALKDEASSEEEDSKGKSVKNGGVRAEA